MELGRIFFAGIAFSTAAAGAVGQTMLVRPGPCAAQTTYLLAANSGAIIQIKPDTTGRKTQSIVFRERDHGGWASQRLLRRFDLVIREGGVTIVNSGEFCAELQAGGTSP